MSDPFATTAIRERVLAAWKASPVRFREDANAEEDLALGGYRDRLVVELAQNAADAAARAGVPGRLRLTLRDDSATREQSGGPVLIAANTGAPLAPEGVEALATLRASAKRDESSTVGRFGVGFAAVLAVTDEPTLLSRTGGVRFSREDTRTLVAEAGEEAPGLAAELRRRSEHVPVLRLPFATEGEPPEGFDTAVLLPLRDEAAADLVRRLLAETDDTLLLALPALQRIEIDADGQERVLADVSERWYAHRVGGVWTESEREQLLADRPTEERDRPYWSVLWAIPRSPEGVTDPLALLTADLAADQPAGAGKASDLRGVVHAPTPTDEPLSLPAVLLASFPLDPTRRHVAEGPLTDRLVEESAKAYVEFVQQRVEAGDDVARFVPIGLAHGKLDGAIRDAIIRKLPESRILRPVDDKASDEVSLLRPSEAVVIDGATDAVERMLAPIVSGLVPFRRSERAAFDALGVRRISLADVVEDLAQVADRRPPSWWQELYVALATLVSEPAHREAFGGLPVPLADGRVVRGARGALLPTVPVGDTSAALPEDVLGVLASFGLRLVHPQVATDATAVDVLERLGARRATPRVLLEDPAVRAAVQDAAESDDPALTDAVLVLVAAAVSAGEARPGEFPWLSDLLLVDASGQRAAANTLVIPDSDAEAVFDPKEFAPVSSELIGRWGQDVLEVVGVASGFTVVTAHDVDLGDLPDNLPDELAELDDIDAWAAELGSEVGLLHEVTAVRDLDFVRKYAWPRALRLLTREPQTRRALVEAPSRTALSYTAWWLRRHVRVQGKPLSAFADPDAGAAVTVLLAPAPDWLAGFDAEVRRALGLVREIGELDVDGVRQLLARLSDPEVDVSAATLLEVWDQLAALDPELISDLPAPERVRVLEGSGTSLVDPGDATVVDAPMWLQRTDLGRHVVAGSAEGATRLAELLDLSLASETAQGAVDDECEIRDVPEGVRRLVPGVPDTWWEHDDLHVDGHPVDWWVDPDGGVHASTGEGLARGLAWAAGRWDQRYAIGAVLAEPDRVDEFLIDSIYD